MFDRIINKKTRLAIVTAMAAALSLTACGGGGGGGGASPPPPPPASRTPQKAVFMAEDTTLGQRHLYAAGDEGGALVPLTSAFTNATGDVWLFEVSPDGRTVAYFADAELDNVFDLYFVDVNGGAPVRVITGFPANTGISQPAWSPDSTQFAYVAHPQGRAPRGFRHNEVFLVNRDGSDHRKINGSVGSPPSVAVSNPHWSPDSRYVLQTVQSLDPFQTVIGFNTHDTSLGTPNSTRVSPALDWRNGENIDYDATWDSTSSRIVYTSDFEANNIRRLYSTAVDGSGTIRLNGSLVSGGDVIDYRVSPDGRSVAYLADQIVDGRYELFVNSVTGSSDVRLTATLGTNSSPRFDWSPDSTRIAFDDDQNIAGVREVYIANADGTSSTRVNRPLSDGQFAGHPIWSPDGRRLGFISDQDEAGRFEIYVVNADGSNERQLSRMDNGGGFAARVWSPDSSMLAYTATQDDPSKQELFVASVDGTANVKVNAELADDVDIRSWGISWSDDGTRIIFSDYFTDRLTRIPDDLDLWVGTTDGAAPIKINDTFDYGGRHAY